MLYSNSIFVDTSREDLGIYSEVAELLIGVNEFVGRMNPKKKESFGEECHSVCRAIAMNVKRLKVVDGYMVGAEQTIAPEGTCIAAKLCDHSWLTTPSGTIIDPYPVGILCGTPLLVCTRGKYAKFASGLYIPNNEVTGRVSGKKMYRKSAVLARIFRQTKMATSNG